MDIGKHTSPGAKRLRRGAQRWARGLAAVAAGTALTTAGALGLSAGPASAAPSSQVSASPASAARHTLPSSFTWQSSGPLISPHSDSHDIVSVKDPSVVQERGRW